MLVGILLLALNLLAKKNKGMLDMTIEKIWFSVFDQSICFSMKYSLVKVSFRGFF